MPPVGLLGPALLAALAALASIAASAPRPSIDAVQQACPGEFKACDADPDCGPELRRSFEPDAPPPSEQPSDLLMGVIRCLCARAALCVPPR